MKSLALDANLVPVVYEFRISYDGHTEFHTVTMLPVEAERASSEMSSGLRDAGYEDIEVKYWAK